MGKPPFPKLSLERRDYWHIGPVYVWKWAVILALAAGSLAILAVFGPPAVFPGARGGHIPTYRYSDRRLAQFSGLVRITDDSGVVRYEGELSQGSCTGTGKVYNAGGQLVYSGPLADGVYEGPDARVYADGILIYEGGMAANRYEGQGRRIDPDTGIVSEGRFSAGVFEGDGTEFYPDGALLRAGVFSNGLLNGEGREYGRDGALLRAGTFAGGLLHGAGTQYTAAGVLRYEGDFRQGVRHGQGTLYDALSGARVYQGTFLQGAPTGFGCIYHASGQLLYEGTVYDAQPRADSFLGLSLAEVEAAFKEHWLLYSYEGVTAFVYPCFQLMFVTQTPIVLTSSAQQEALAEQERQELLDALASQTRDGEETAPEAQAVPAPAQTPMSRAADPAGDWALSPDTVKSDVLITQVLSYGAPLAGAVQPEYGLPSGRRDAGWREWFSDFAAGEPLAGDKVVQTGPFVYEFTASTSCLTPDCGFYLTEDEGVEFTTVLREGKDSLLWYQSAVRKDGVP